MRICSECREPCVLLFAPASVPRVDIESFDACGPCRATANIPSPILCRPRLQAPTGVARENQADRSLFVPVEAAVQRGDQVK